ncbi:MAG: hypothetical protein K6E27_05450 [Eubacterium sp.]|nr:hypothetical protein [Eubacterium sp.]
MNKLDKLKKRGISLRNLNIVMLGLAIKYLFNDEYLTSKRQISNDMNDCLDRLENEVAAS